MAAGKVKDGFFTLRFVLTLTIPEEAFTTEVTRGPGPRFGVAVEQSTTRGVTEGVDKLLTAPAHTIVRPG